MSCATFTKHIDRHFAASIDPASERTMRQHMPSCEACRTYYERHLALANVDPDAPSAEERLAVGLGLRPPRVERTAAPRTLAPRARAALGAVAAGVALAAAVLLFVRARHVDDDGFTARGHVTASSGSASAGAAMPRAHVYRVPRGETAVPVVGAIGRSDELAFAYENATPGERLLVYAVDEHRHVYWYYPAWTNASDDPAAVPIEADGRRHELPDAVSHHYDGDHLEVHAVFVDSVTTVKQIEAMLERKEAAPAAWVDRTIVVDVTP